MTRSRGSVPVEETNSLGLTLAHLCVVLSYDWCLLICLAARAQSQHCPCTSLLTWRKEKLCNTTPTELVLARKESQNHGWLAGGAARGLQALSAEC